MFGIIKERLMKNLNIIQKSVCAYGRNCSEERNWPCDCKFGIGDEEHHNPLSETFSGCCELSQVYRLLETMTEDEFEDLCIRAKIIL